MERALACASLVAGLVLLLAPGAAAQTSAAAVEIEVTGAVDPLLARYVTRALSQAADDGAAAVVLRIDTPGGLDSAMRSIIRAIHSSSVPLTCWVGPSGARAASAGAIIALACPHTTMAPATNIGAAHPVGFQGEVLDEKVTNDAAAYARAQAERRGRDPDLVEQMVRRSLSLSAAEAVEREIAAEIAADRRAALRALARARDGEDSIAAARIARAEMSFVESLLHTVVDPNIAFLMLTLGLLGIASEFLHPGITVGGVGGTLLLLAALIVLGMLPVNVAGVLLILAGIALMAVEPFVPGGVVGAVGAVGVLAGGLFLFDDAVPGAQVSRALVVGTVASLAAFFFVAMRAVLRTRTQHAATPTLDELVGEVGVVERALAPEGIVRLRNESWTARADHPIVEGAPVRVTRVEGLTLEVEPAETTVGEGGRS